MERSLSSHVYKKIAPIFHACEAAGHIEAGAKKVIISAPGKGDLKTLVSEDCT